MSRLPIGGNPGLRDGDHNRKHEEIRMIGDFDGSANALWALYGKEAKSYDEACIQTLKDDMDGVLIFVRSYFVHHSNEFDHVDLLSHRPVYLPPLSPPLLSTASRT